MDKTLLERFHEMENDIKELKATKEEMTRAMGELLDALSANIIEVNLLKEQMQALYVLTAEGRAFTVENVADIANKNRLAKMQALIDADEKNGLLEKKDCIESENDLVSYSSSDVLLSLKTVSSLKDLYKIPLEKLIGLKSGDSVDGITIKAVYKTASTLKEDSKGN